jgi:DNA-3-methyladenine glycosylase II
MRLLDAQSYQQGLDYLSQQDGELAAVLREFGNPPQRLRDEGFATLVKIILEQKVSLSSANAVYLRLCQLTRELSPLTLLAATPEQLYAIGISRQKISYCQHLANAILAGELELAALNQISDEDVIKVLTKIKGIGNWTASIYLLMSLRRLDVWPRGDLALVKAVRVIKSLSASQGEAEIALLSQCWQPWRSVAARVCWHYYLSNNLQYRKA